MKGMTVVMPQGSTFRMFVWGDFNDLGAEKKDHLTVLVDYWVPQEGALVVVRDYDGNSMQGEVVKVWRTTRCKPWERLALVKCDRDSWKDGAAPSPTPAGEAGERDTQLSRTDDRMGT